MKHERLVPLYAVGGASTSETALAYSRAELRGYPAASHRGVAGYLSAETGDPISIGGKKAYTVAGRVGAKDLRVGPTALISAWPGSFGTTIHANELTVTEGSHTVKLNTGCGGYIHSWVFGATELLNRGNRWSRGIQAQATWVDVRRGHLMAHRPVQGGSVYSQPPAPHGAILVSKSVTSPASGGKVVTVQFIPIEYMPDGTDGVLGVSTDHQGSEDTPVLWSDVLVTQELWLDYGGTAGLCRLLSTWELLESRQGAAFDYGISNLVHLDADQFDTVRAYDGSTATDLTAAVDAVEGRRWTQSRAGKWQDNVASPSAATDIANELAAIIASNGSNLSVAVGSRLPTISAGLDLDVADLPRGSQFTYGTKRAGTGGLDGDDFVLVGHDAMLTSRFHDDDSLRTIGPTNTLETWICVSATLAGAQALVGSIPA